MWTIAVASRIAPDPVVCVATIVEGPETGVKPTSTLNVPSVATATLLAASDPSTATLTGLHGDGQKPDPRTVTRWPGLG